MVLRVEKRNELGRKNKTEAKREGKVKGKYTKCQEGEMHRKASNTANTPRNLSTESRGSPTLWQMCPPLLFSALVPVEVRS